MPEDEDRGPRTADEVEAYIATERQRADFFEAHARHANALAGEEELSLRAKERVESVVLAQNEFHKVYVFDQPVHEKSVKQCVAQLTTWSRNFPECDIELQINSPGGDIFEGFALIDFLRDLRGKGHKVTAVTFGMAASMGGVILQAADVRVMGENSFLLLHEGSLFAAGDYGHVEDEYKLMQLLHQRILTLFADRAKVSKAFIQRNWKRKDWWLPADEALKLGFVDEVR